MQFWPLTIALEFPRKHCCMIFIVAQRLAIGCLMFLAKMRAGGFIALECVDAHQLRELQKIGDASRAFQSLIIVLLASEHADTVPEFFSQFRNFLERFA